LRESLGGCDAGVIVVLNLGTLFEKITSAKVPPKFTYDFLQTTIGLRGSNDRSLITLLKNLGFIDASGTPTNTYSLLKSGDRKKALAAGIRTAYAPLFDSDDKANELSGDKLKSLVAQIAGTDDDMTARIASTFAALTKLADFTGSATPPPPRKEPPEVEEEDSGALARGKLKGLRTEFHYNIQVHLPVNGTEETYQNIFNAIRKTFL
jgi:hypothetical protein